MIEAAILAALAALLYHLGLGFLLFLIPLQVALVRRGPRAFYAAAGLGFALVVLTRGARVLLAGHPLTEALPFLGTETATVAALIGGLVLVQLPELEQRLARFRLRRVPRLLAVTALVGVLSVPLIASLRANEAFVAQVRLMFEDLVRQASQAGAAWQGLQLSSQAAGQAGAQGQVESLMALFGRLMSRSFLSAYFFVLAFAWWLGSLLGARSAGRPPAVPLARDFRLPDAYVWPLIASLAVVASSLVLPLGALEPIAWNLLLIMLLLYGVAGLGVIRVLMARFGLPARLRWLFVGAMIMLAFVRLEYAAAALSAAMILVPALGVSEIWLHYRKERSEIHNP